MKNTFKWLNWSQFTGAFNDNAFKMASVIALVRLQGAEQLPVILAVCSALFILPFLLFSNAAGMLADRFSKRDIIVVSKWLEIGLFVLAVPALLSGWAWPLYGLLFLLCTQSALFGPAKRGIVPELVEDEDLSRANGALTAATYAAVILGTAMPSLLIGYFGLSALWPIGGCAALAVTGTWTAYRIARVPATGEVSRISPWIVPDVVHAMRRLREDRWARLAVWALVLFGGVAALFQQTLVIYGQEALGMSLETSPMLFVLTAVGIGVGALLTGRLSRHTVEVGLIPVGALGVTVSAIGISVAVSPLWICGWILMLGMCSGMFLVPLNAFLQHRIPAEHRGKVFGAENFLSFGAMVVASGLFYGMTEHLHMDSRSCVFATAMFAAVPAVVACMRLPASFVRFWIIRLVKRLYRVRFEGLENIPREGGAMLICNHTAYADGLLLQAATSRPVRFVMSRDVFKNWKWAKPLFHLTSCIPIHTSDGPRALAKSLREARETLKSGAVVGIFPEGALSRNGNMMKFNKGFEKIARDTGCPIIPAYIDNLWGSIFSYKYGKPGFRMPECLPRRVTVRFGKALPTDTTAEEARRVITELGAEDATEKSMCEGQTLSHRFVRQSRRRWTQKIAKDTLGQRVTYGRLLTGSVLLANRMKPLVGDDPHVGIYLPTAIGNVLANLAVTLSGKTSVNLNWSASLEAQCSAVKQAHIKTVITSRRFLQKMEQASDLPVQWLCLEDLLANVGVMERVRALCAALFASPKALADGREPQPGDTATIIFSSGTTGMPKGVMLSHANIVSNINAVHAVQPFGRDDSMCAVLPLFHAFGYLALLWWPLLKGIRTVYHPNPLQSGRIVRLIREEKITAILATPTFLQSYMRKAEKADFQSLEMVFTGGEKLRTELARAFKDKFGIQPLEGYGCTELSPVAMLSLRNGHRTGSVGQPLPGIAVRMVDPETGENVSGDQEGLMQVKGPNVMQGYLGQPDKTSEVLRDGWYNTGDIARMDSHGFIYVTGRLSRFSKIAGEMVPHAVVEDALQQASGTEEPCVAVLGVADEQKGEQLAVCFTEKAGDPESLIARLRGLNLPNLWIPRPSRFVRIPSMPVLATGKLDLQALQKSVKCAVARV